MNNIKKTILTLVIAIFAINANAQNKNYTRQVALCTLVEGNKICLDFLTPNPDFKGGAINDQYLNKSNKIRTYTLSKNVKFTDCTSESTKIESYKLGKGEIIQIDIKNNKIIAVYVNFPS